MRVRAGLGLVRARLAHEHHALARGQDLRRLLAAHERWDHPLSGTVDNLFLYAQWPKQEASADKLDLTN